MNYVMYVLCMLIWGLNFIAVKIQGNHVSLEVALLYRSVIALILFTCLLSFVYKKISIKDFNLYTVLGFGICNFMISYLLLYYGTFYSTAAMVTLIFSMKAIITPICISIAFKTKISSRIYIGGIMGILSVLVILFPDLKQLSNQFIIGILLAIAGTVITSIGDVLSLYNSKQRVNPIVANTIGMMGAVILLFMYTFIRGDHYTMPHQSNFWIGLLYLSVLASFIAWLCYLKLINNIGAAESGYMVAMFPAIGGIASVLMGESTLNIHLIIGIALATSGAYIALKKPKHIKVKRG